MAPINAGGAVPAQTYGDVTTLSTSGLALNQPYQSVFDASGNLFVADVGSNTIKKITPAGVVSIFAGSTVGTAGTANGTGTAARFSSPDGIAIDPSDNLYVADYSNNRIRKITPAGVVSNFATGITGPAGITYSAGNLYIAEQGGNSIVKIVVSTVTVTTFAGSTMGTAGFTDATGTAARFNQPGDVIADASGNLTVTDYGNNAIRSITSAGVVTTIAGSTAGTAGTTNATGTAARFSGPYGITKDGEGNFYIVDATNNQIRKMTSSNVVTLMAGSTTAGSTDGITTAARFSSPSNITSDGSGYLYISDVVNSKIRKLSICGYTVSPALPTGLTMSPTTGIITGTPSATQAATSYTVTAYNYYGSSSTTITIAVTNSDMDINDANTAANGITQGVLRPGETNAVLFGFSFRPNSAMTISGFKLNATITGAQGAGFFFTNGKLYKNTTANTFDGATLVTSTGVAFNGYTPSNPAITITGLSEAFTNSDSPVYYFIVGDVISNYNTFNAASQTVQFKFQTTQTDAVSSSTPSANYAPNINVNGTTFTIAPPTLTVSNNNFIANGITNGPISFGQTDIVLFSFKLVVDGVFNVTTFNNISCTVNANAYFQGGKLYRSTTPYFSDAVQVPGVVTFPGSYAQVLSANEQFNSYTGASTYYYFLVGNLTNTSSGTGTVTFSLPTSTYAFTQSSPSKQYYPSVLVTGLPFTVLTTYVWVGGTVGNLTNFSTAGNYRTLLNGAVGGAPGSTTAIYISQTVPSTGVTVTNAPTLSGNITIPSLTFDGTVPPTLSLSTRTLTVNNKLIVNSGTTATITGTGTVTIPNTALTSALAGSAILKVTGSAAINNAGTFTMAQKSALNVTAGTVTNTGTFTLKSDSTGSATIGPVPSATTFTGDYIVQRYVTGDTSHNIARNNYKYRNYRIMSSPVSTGTNSGFNYSSLAYIPLSSIVTGTTTGGTLTTGNPTLYFYREDYAGTNASFTSSNFRGITAISSTDVTVDGASKYLYAGMGYLFYFRGNNSNVSSKTTAPYAAPESVTFANTGTLNQGDITVANWVTNTSALSKTTVATANSQGLQLVGNPYASSINWDTSAGFGGTATVGTTIYAFNPVSGQYETYVRGAGGAGSGGANSNIIASGQAFFIKLSANGTFIFKEAAKTTTQLSPSTNLLLGKPVNAVQDVRFLRLRLALDNLNNDNIVILFKDGTDDKYVENEDGLDLGGSGALESLSARSSDDVALAVNSLQLPKTTAKIIPLSVDAFKSGVYSLSLNELKNLPKIYQVWLKDKFKKDSLDLRANTTYKFNIDKTNAASFGKDRFELIIRQNPDLALKLLTFDANKVSAGAQLSWISENESNYTNYTVERSIDGGKTFEVIGGLNSNGDGKYILIDKAPVIGENQYRLKQDDINGTITYSQIATLMYSNSSNNIIVSNLSIYPNPATTNVNIAILVQNATASYTITITNSSGTVMKSAKTTQANWQANVSNFLPGSYFVQVKNNETNILVGNGKFVKL
ncbi:T9SS type A sorting domain-containing protein [Mucilaginibacter terrigena]|uniref:T9SS type A sorting domain-containing protein n=1 Tax=Mucilaginibacter terrigena TaxID=2492395 RepID=A0A4Q5LLW6_9SPHI|nr:T9SS type A sorting domain-containing protein [Mucilaginibacter terrigena]RYU90744.1 T9SS type A sorting domain-containing protein [Mucilaginibacter terrigena]